MYLYIYMYLYMRTYVMQRVYNYLETNGKSAQARDNTVRLYLAEFRSASIPKVT